MAERFVKYTSRSGGTTRVYRVLGSYTDEIMYGVRRGQRVRCLRLEKPWAPGESFGVLASRCEDVAAPVPLIEAQVGEEYEEHGLERAAWYRPPIDEEEAYERRRYVECQERGIPF